MKSYTFRGKQVQLPTCVEELTSDQYLRFLRLYCCGPMSDVQQVSMMWASYLVGLKVSQRLLRSDIREQLAGIAGDLAPAFFRMESDGTATAVIDTMSNMLPQYNGHAGPADMLDGLPFEKFVECTTLLGEIGEDVEAMEIYASIARALYCIDASEDVPAELAIHATLLFSNVWKTIQSQPIILNGREVDLRLIFQGAESGKKDDGTGWLGVAFELAATGVFGTLADINRTDFWLILLYLYKCKFEYLNEQKNTK